MKEFALSNHSVKLRWINCQCFEITLPNGKTIVTDPCYDFPKNPDSDFANLFRMEGFTTENLTGCDYVILNHTHGDHMSNLEQIVERFHPVVVCHSGVAVELANVIDNLPLTSVYPVDYNGRYFFDGFRMDTWHGMHKPQSLTWKQCMKMGDIISQQEKLYTLHTMGGFFNMNYLLTLDNGFRIAFVGGLDDGASEHLREERPNIVFRNKLRNEMDVESVAADWLSFMRVSHAQIVVPMHFEPWESMQPGFSEKTFIRANELAEEAGIYSRMLSPKQAEWYSFDLCVSQIR